MHFVGGEAEILYFALWLKEYAARYDQWALDLARKETSSLSCVPFSPSLAAFYAKAQQTFFLPGSEYELDVAADVLAPLIGEYEDGTLISAYGPHPDPAVELTELSSIVNSRLEFALKQCVIASYTK
jgi:hypothetical protein